MTDDGGRLVSQPLRCGGGYCVLHAKPFVVRPAPLDEAAAVVVFLDLESTGVDVARDRIVELAATQAPADPRLAGSSYSTVVCVDPMILKERGSDAAAVHGITDEEISLAPSFVEAWARFVRWTEDLLNIAVVDIDMDTDDDEPRAPQLEETPVLLMAAHNGVRASAYGGSGEIRQHSSLQTRVPDRGALRLSAVALRSAPSRAALLAL